MKIKQVLLLLLSMGLMISCSLVDKKIYDGPELPNDQISVLEESKEIQVLGIDAVSTQEKYPGMDVSNFKMQPGKHTIKTVLDPMPLVNVDPGQNYNIYKEIGYRSPMKEITYNFLAGHRYLIKAKESLSVKEFEPEIIDQSK